MTFHFEYQILFTRFHDIYSKIITFKYQLKMNTKVSEDFDLFNPSKKPVPQTSSSNTFSMTSQSVEASSFKQPNEYSLTFKIPYKTELGQSLCVVGSIGQLGNWKDFKAHLKWTEGHVWVLPNVSISSSNCVF